MKPGRNTPREHAPIYWNEKSWLARERDDVLLMDAILCSCTSPATLKRQKGLALIVLNAANPFVCNVVPTKEELVQHIPAPVMTGVSN